LEFACRHSFKLGAWSKEKNFDRIYRISRIVFLSFLMKLRRGSSSQDILLADEDIIMVSPKDPAMSSFRLTSSFCLTSGKAEEIPVNPVDPVKVRHGFSTFTPSLDGSLSQLQRRLAERADEVQAPPLWFTAPFLE